MKHDKIRIMDWSESFSDRVAYGRFRYVATFFTKTLLFSSLCFLALLFFRQARQPPEVARSAAVDFGLVVLPLTLAFIIREIWGKRIYLTNGGVDIRYAGWGGRYYRTSAVSQFSFSKENNVDALSIKTKSGKGLWITIPSDKRNQIQDFLDLEEATGEATGVRAPNSIEEPEN